MGLLRLLSDVFWSIGEHGWQPHMVGKLGPFMLHGVVVEFLIAIRPAPPRGS